jgi:hypothetical protein
MVFGWVNDAIANEDVNEDEFDGSLKSAMDVLEDAGLVTFSRKED